MKKFSDLILENLGNIYQLGTPFSNGHRSRTSGDGFLFDRHNMIDIDEVIFDDKGNIWGILENKKRTPHSNSKLKNILTKTTSQKLALTELCNKLGCHFFVQIELEETYHLIENLNVTKTFTKKKFDDTITSRNYSRLKTDNVIFIEFRNPIKFVSVDIRISDADSEIKKFGQSISTSLGVPFVEIDDSGDYIEFSLNGVSVGKVKSILNPNSVTGSLRSSMEIKWVWLYKQLGIFN